MNEMISRLQKDLHKLQNTFEKEGEILLERIRKTASQAEDNVAHRREEVADLIEKQIKKFEPALEKFYKELKTNAARYGVDLSDIEDKVRSTTKKAAAKLRKPASGKKKASTKKKASNVGKKAKKKTAGKKTTAKKTTAKKSSATKKKTAKKSSKK